MLISTDEIVLIEHLKCEAEILSKVSNEAYMKESNFFNKYVGESFTRLEGYFRELQNSSFFRTY